MDGRVFIGMVLGVGLSGCGGVDSDWQQAPSAPSFFGSPTPVEGIGAGVSVGSVAPVGPYGGGGTVVSSATFSLTGYLEGQLHVVELAGDTTDNTGTFDLWDSGSGNLYVNLAARGNGGAGMLMIGITSPDIANALSNGQWSTADAATGAVSVNGCAGPVMGQWDNELPAVGFDMSAEEAPEDPGTVLVQIKAQFPLDAAAAWTQPLNTLPTSELRGTFSFQRFAQLE